MSTRNLTLKVRKSSEVPADNGFVEETPLTPYPYPEIIIGLVGPVGTDLNPISVAIERQFEALSYRAKTIRLSEKLERFFGENHSTKPEHERISGLMDIGTKLREESGRGDAVALLGIAEIKRIREADPGNKSERNAYVLRSLKHPHEIQTLRSVYGKGFFLISVYSPREARVAAMAERITRSMHGNTSHAREWAESIIERDEREEDKKLGQDVKDAFPLADLFIDGRDKRSYEAEIRRFFELIFGNVFYTPTRDEYGMYQARSAALRSADLGRQVGAAISKASGEILSLGCNDVPKAGGDLYWPDDAGDSRDFRKGFDPMVDERKQILSELLNRFREAELLAKQYSSEDSIGPLLKALTIGDKKKTLERTRVYNLLEFGRSVHAEMAAITSAARLGIAIKDATLFSTTFPCHMCARHIVSSGIKRVLYIEPYPKSRALQLHGDAIQVDTLKPAPGFVTFEPFVGIAPRQYQDLFDAEERRKDQSGEILNWRSNKSSPKPRFIRFLNTYLDLEQVIVAKEIPLLARKLNIKLPDQLIDGDHHEKATDTSRAGKASAKNRRKLVGSKTSRSTNSRK
jgi:deoxycytidylate deaminase